MKKKLSILLTLLVLTFCTSISYAQTPFFWCSFYGKIAGSNVEGSFSMNEGGSVDGSYAYSKYSNAGSRAEIPLRGTWRKTGSVTYTLTLTEYGNNGRKSGTWNVTFNDNTGRLTGTMRNAKGKTYRVNCEALWD